MVQLKSRSFAIDGLSLASVNAVAWALISVMLLSRWWLRSQVARRASEFGIDPRFQSLEAIIKNLLSEISRKNASLSINLMQQRIVSKEDLSRAFERIVSQGFKLLSAESAELALFDGDSGLYHSAFVVGKPFKVSAQAMLSNASNSEEERITPDVLVQPIAFAGAILGTLRVRIAPGKIPTLGDREVMNLLALQAGLALMNSRYSEELLRMKRASEESSRAKTGFLANLSHEIRGPLGIMLNAVELVLDGLCGAVSADQLETLKMVHSNGQHLLELINDVLDYAKVESGRVVPKKVVIVVNELLKDLAGVVRSQAEAKGHKVIAKPSDEALAISCDRRHARQILINLPTNAVKYTPDGGKIEVWAERFAGNRIKILVKDTGVGIANEDRSKVFAAFERIENSYSMNQVGTGLGMPLTKKLVEVNGGNIDFESKSGEGTTFWISFPAVQAEEARLEEETDNIVEVDGKGNGILLVERDEGERNMISRYLSHIGFRVLASGAMIEAMQQVRENKIDLAVIGNNVADNPDEDIVSMVRKNAAHEKLPVIVVSSRAFVFDIERYLKAGVDRCLVKPLKLKELASICRTLIDGTYSGEIIDRDVVDVKGDKNKDNAPVYNTRMINLRDVH